MHDSVAPTKVETCTFPVYFDGDRVRMLLGRQRFGPNQGKWVPIGREIEASEFAWDVASADVGSRGLDASGLAFRGLVTEVAAAGWQVYLLLFVARQHQRLEVPPDEFADQFVWVTALEANSLDKAAGRRTYQL